MTTPCGSKSVILPLSNAKISSTRHEVIANVVRGCVTGLRIGVCLVPKSCARRDSRPSARESARF
jgi:hypothetical protein